MDYHLTVHARQRMRERSIPKQIIEETLRNPTTVSYDNRGRLLIKKLYRKKGKNRLLLLAAETVGVALIIITVIDTSKVRKYL